MTTQAWFTVRGLEEYLESIQQAGVNIDAAAQRALEKGAKILEAEMESHVPVGETGNLLAHVEIDGPHQLGNYSFVDIGVIHNAGLTDAETAIYGNVQEYGSPSKNIPAKPYIRPSIDSKKSAVAKAVRESLKAEGLAD